jgi:penicillin-binding protein 1A
VKWLAAALGLAIAAATGCIIGALTVLGNGLPEVMALEQFRPASSTIIYSSDSEVLAEFAAERRTPVELSEMPPLLLKSFLAIEDHRFFEHFGINIGRVLKAVATNLVARGYRQGASTITQQLAKVLFLTPDKTLERKLREAILALEIEQTYTKEEILSFYLNQIYLGNGAHGVAAAADVYFGKTVGSLSLGESALLAAIPKNPSKYNPFGDAEQSRIRRNIVINRLLALGWIEQEEATAAKAEPLPDTPYSRPTSNSPYFVEAVRRELIEKFGADRLYKGGLRVYTTLDFKLQQQATLAMDEGLVNIAERHPENPEPVQGALVAIDPATGAVLAHIGGANWKTSKFDRTFQARRQMGSTFKPIIYIAALEAGMNQASTLYDAPAKFPGSHPKKPWEPKNYDKKYKGKMTLRRALAHSRNLPAIKLMEKLGVAPVTAVARRMGLNDELGTGLASALGVGSATLYELTTAYATLATGGLRPTPYRIRAVYGPDGRSLWDSPPSPRRSLSPETAFIASDMLREVVQNGTGRKARAIPFPIAGKTGTTDEQRDASFIGFSSQLALGVWVGRDDNSPLGRYETGSKAALPIWVDTMLASSERGIPPPWPAPIKIKFSEIDLESGMLADSQCEETTFAAFTIDNAPEATCTAEELAVERLTKHFNTLLKGGLSQ